MGTPFTSQLIRSPVPRKRRLGGSDKRFSSENQNEKRFRRGSDKRGSPGIFFEKHFRGGSDLRVFRSKLSYQVAIGFMKYGKSDPSSLRFLGTGERISWDVNGVRLEFFP